MSPDCWNFLGTRVKYLTFSPPKSAQFQLVQPSSACRLARRYLCAPRRLRHSGGRPSIALSWSFGYLYLARGDEMSGRMFAAFLPKLVMVLPVALFAA